MNKLKRKSKPDAVTILHQESSKFPKKPSDEILNEEELNVALVFYEWANWPSQFLENACNNDTKAEKQIGKRKFEGDGSTSRSCKKANHVITLDDTNDPKAIQEKLCGKNSKKKLNPSSEFPFSVLHLVSAVRAALTASLMKSPLENIINSKEFTKQNFPFLDIHQIVEGMRSYPGDPFILQSQTPLIELVRGVLNVFSSETPWGPLTAYERLKKKWQWIGTVPCNSIYENVDMKLANQFSIWLRSSHTTLNLMANLPEPPLNLMREKDIKTRFKNRKRLNQGTFGETCEEVRAYFHREEAIRYLIPDTGFHYTALDGKKSAVAPLRKNRNKVLTKSRGHYIFKANRPPQFSLLTLVRDAAARLPGGMGTRSDICNLVRDSQYIIENVGDKTVKGIVSGALDRLHCEVDPCVEYIGKWGLWVYLHKDREIEDFIQNGTSSVRRDGC